MYRFPCNQRAITVALLACLFLPTVSRADEADELFQSLFGERLKAALSTRDFEDDMALAKALLGTVGTVGAEKRVIDVICTKAFEIASRRPEGYRLSTEALGVLYRTVPDRRRFAMEKSVAIGRKIYIRTERDERQQVATEVVNNMMLLAAELDKANDNQAGIATLRQARQFAISAKSDNVKEVSDYYERALQRHQLILRKEKLDQELLRNAGNTEAAEELVTMFMTGFDDPAKALSFQDRMKNPALAQIVKLANKPIEQRTDDELLKLADWYRMQIEQPTSSIRKMMAMRAAAGYKLFLDKHDKPGIQRTKAELSFQQLEKELSAEEFALLPTTGVEAKKSQAITVAGTINAATKEKIVRGLNNGDWVELIGLVDSKSHCDGEHKVSHTKDGTIVSLTPAAGGISEFIVPIVLEGSFDVEVRLALVNNGGKFSAFMPTTRGWASNSLTPRPNGAGQFLALRFGVEQVKDGMLTCSIHVDGRPFQRGAVKDSHLKWPKDRLENRKPATPIIQALEHPQRKRSASVAC